MNKTKYYTPYQVASILGIHANYINFMIRNEKIPAVKIKDLINIDSRIGETSLITDVQVKKLLKSRGK